MFILKNLTERRWFIFMSSCAFLCKGRDPHSTILIPDRLRCLFSLGPWRSLGQPDLLYVTIHIFHSGWCWQECQSCKTSIKTGAENRRTQVCSLLLEMVVAPGSCREGDRPVSGGGSKGLSRHVGESMKGDKRKAEKKKWDNTVFIQNWLYFYLILRTPLLSFISSQTLLGCSQPSFSFSYSAEPLFATTKKINLKT